MHMHDMDDASLASFSTDVSNLPAAGPPALVDLAPGDSFDLRIHPVAKRIGEDTMRMLAYNGSIPGPILRVQQGSHVVVNVSNEGDIDATVHWHGLRLENAYDGVPHETQKPVPVGGSYSHRLTFPDAGLFWYHPHIREDFAQEMGLYGNLIVAPSDPDYWPPADRELVLTLDDILIEDGRIAPFSVHGPDHVAMGRFGNVLLVGGKTEQKIEVRRGEVVRFYLTNTANTRVFKVSLPGASMKLVGSDGGRYEREELVEDVVIAPSERAIVDVLFERPGSFVLEHTTPERTYVLADLTVGEQAVEPSLGAEFATLRTNAEMVAERRRIARHFDAPPDKTLALIAEMDLGQHVEGPTVYSCPMHPEVTSDQPGKCPKCGMKLVPAAAPSPAYACPMHPEVTSDEPGRCPKCGMKLMPAEHVAATTAHTAGHGQEGHMGGHGDAPADGVEWEDQMPEVNRMTTPANMRWKLIDRDTGQEGALIDWSFAAGDQVKIRLVNEMDSDHPMHHPFHIHGQRFLVLARDGVKEPNLVWKDTVLVRTGQTVDVLMDASNPGLWMAHCHIAEHIHSGMMFSFRVEREAER